jgi:hypothetical protein
MTAWGEIDDAESIVPECNSGLFANMSSPIVGAAMADGVEHSLKISHPAPTRVVEEPPGNATHWVEVR